MRQAAMHVRRTILSKLYEHLEQHYSITWPRDSFLNGRVTDHQIDAVLAFKTDPDLDELRHALERLAEGTYGHCLACKKRIDRVTLDLNPTQRVCATCERDLSHYEAHSVGAGVTL